MAVIDRLCLDYGHGHARSFPGMVPLARSLPVLPDQSLPES